MLHILQHHQGADGLDARQYIPPTLLLDYTRHLHDGVKGLKIGVLKEGFGTSDIKDGKLQDEKVRFATQIFTKLGAQVSQVSIPYHSNGQAIWSAIFFEGFLDQMIHGLGSGTGHKGLYVPSTIAYYSNWKKHANQFADTVKLCCLIGQYMSDNYPAIFHAKGHNLERKLTEAYNKFFQQYDLLIMPTTPFPAQKLPSPTAPREEIISAAFNMIANTAAFDVTGHPAMNVPCGMADGRPVGMMLVGKQWDEATIYKAAYAFEQGSKWLEQ